ncbi:single-strand DNA-binding protein [Deinobacterium chartae]|uniref:Single-stranded DNA-binding protein n=1 Tax=Deinobacterium chartae TaxID=521158 RepID=A0A841I128_9DEIO|nr:single-stranded DNA-binding protein [Deinobacterium chartae]MBB6098933.1 single-strand DNA-binding protein [Deinobacterium chartae]
MARGMNHVYLVGALARDPELRYTAGGVAVCEVTVAGEDLVIGSDGRERRLPWYHRVSLMGKPAESVAEQYKAGDAVMVEGSLEYRAWETPEGQKRSAVNIKGLRVEGVQRSDELVRDAGGGVRLPNGLNHAVLVGNLTRDPELRYTPGGDAVLGVGLAVNESWKGRDGNWQERTHWLDVTLWRELAEATAQLKKGDPLMVLGRVTNESWTDREGNKRISTKVEATRVEALTRGPSAPGGAVTTPAASRGAYGNAPAAAKAAGSRSSGLDIDEGLHDFPPEEDLPF